MVLDRSLFIKDNSSSSHHHNPNFIQIFNIVLCRNCVECNGLLIRIPVYRYQCGQSRVTCEFQLLVPQHMYIVIYIIYTWHTYYWLCTTRTCMCVCTAACGMGSMRQQLHLDHDEIMGLNIFTNIPFSHVYAD